MILDLRKVQDEGVSVDVRLSLPEVTDELGTGLLAGPARVVAWARPGDLGVEFSGRLEAVLRLSCSRCLEPYELPVRADFSLNVIEEAAPDLAGEIAADGDDATVFRAPASQLDLGLLASEQIYLQLPLKPICSESCAGLCPSCGANRNGLECGCPRGGGDLRLAALEDLRRRFGAS